MKSILDRSFRYTPSAETDLRKTFARIRRAQAKAAAERAQAEEQATQNVVGWPMREARKGTGS